DEPAPGSPQSLVGSGRHVLGVGDGARVQPGGYKTRNVGHVHKEDSPHGVANGPQPGKVDDARVSAGAGHDHLGLDLASLLFQLVVVDLLGFRVDAVAHKVVEAARQINRVAVGQVAAVGQGHPHDGVARLEGGKVHSLVGLGA